jgi:2-aminoethylphosphonate transport system substrate-binding protein
MSRFSRARLLAAATGCLLLGLTAGCGGTAGATTNATTVTVYTADGLGDWYTPTFAAFTKKTGIKVQTVEDGSGVVESRVEKEAHNPQADLLITLPPFIQKAAKAGMLTDLSKAAGVNAVPAADRDPKGLWTTVVNNYLCFVYNPKFIAKPNGWNDLLAPKLAGKLQYSTPGQAGDGTAVLVLATHQLGGSSAALQYLKKLQANNKGPSASTGKLQPLVTKGELYVANGDVQMDLALMVNEKAGFDIWFPKNTAGKPETLALPYAAGLVAKAPHGDAGKQLLSYLLSKDAQSTVAKTAFGVPVLTGLPADPALGKLRAVMNGVEVHRPDWNTVLASLDQDVAAYNAATGQA